MHTRHLLRSGDLHPGSLAPEPALSTAMLYCFLMEVIKINPLGLRFYKLLVCLYGNHMQSPVLLDSHLKSPLTIRATWLLRVPPNMCMWLHFIWLLTSSSHKCSILGILILVHVGIVYIWFPSCNPEQKREGGREESRYCPPLSRSWMYSKVLWWSSVKPQRSSSKVWGRPSPL